MDALGKIRLPVLAAALLGAAGFLSASETLLLNTSPARDCYLAVVDGGTVMDVETCTLAIEHQMLTPTDLAATYSNRGILLARNGDLAAALQDHDRALSLAPDMASVHINRSNALVAAKRYEEALASLEQAISMADASLAVAHYNRALMFNTLGDRRAARADAEKAAELAPETAAYQKFVRALSE